VAREHVITLKLNEGERERFEYVADDMGLDMSAMIRTLVREREKTIPPRPGGWRKIPGSEFKPASKKKARR